MQFLGLRERGACAMQMELNPGAALFQRALVAQQRAPRDTGGKVEGLFGGELFARGDKGRQRRNADVEQAAGHGGAEVFFCAVSGRARGGAELPKDRRSVHAPMEEQTDDAGLRIFGNQADFALRGHRFGDDRSHARRGFGGGAGGENGLCERLCHAEEALRVRSALQDGGIFPRKRGGCGQTGARTAGTGGVVGHAGADRRQARAHGRFVQAFAEVDDAVPRAGNFGIDDVRRGAVQNEQPGMRNGHAVQTVRIAGTEVQG